MDLCLKHPFILPTPLPHCQVNTGYTFNPALPAGEWENNALFCIELCTTVQGMQGVQGKKMSCSLVTRIHTDHARNPHFHL